MNNHLAEMENENKADIKPHISLLNTVECKCCQEIGRQHDKLWFCRPCNPPHEVVFAKVKGYSFWPAKVIKKQDNMAVVKFFGGSHKRAVIADKYMKSITTDVKELKIKNTSSFKLAWEELKQHLEIIKKSVSGSTSDADENESVPELKQETDYTAQPTPKKVSTQEKVFVPDEEIPRWDLKECKIVLSLKDKKKCEKAEERKKTLAIAKNRLKDLRKRPTITDEKIVAKGIADSKIKKKNVSKASKITCQTKRTTATRKNGDKQNKQLLPPQNVNLRGSKSNQKKSQLTQTEKLLQASLEEQKEIKFLIKNTNMKIMDCQRTLLEELKNITSGIKMCVDNFSIFLGMMRNEMETTNHENH